jgi:hypothetical protein
LLKLKDRLLEAPGGMERKPQNRMRLGISGADRDCTSQPFFGLGKVLLGEQGSRLGQLLRKRIGGSSGRFFTLFCAVVA